MTEFSRPARNGYMWVKIHSGPHEGRVVEVAENGQRVRLAYKLPLPRFISNEAVQESISIDDMSHEYKRVYLSDYYGPKGSVWLPAEWNDAAVAHWIEARFK